MNRYLYFTVFSAGLTTLAVELSASRLLGPYFGTSDLIWATIIGLILIYLMVGYLLGGRLADRSPNPAAMFTLIAWGAFASGLIPYAAGFVLRPAAAAMDQFRFGVLIAAFVTVLLIFLIPVILLGTVSPFAIRLAIKETSSAGRVSGTIYAISTLGSFVGSFLPGLVLIPWLGTRGTYLFFGLFLLAVALVGLALFVSPKRALAYLWMPIFLILFAAWQAQTPLKDTAGQIYETESSYNYIQVLEIDGYRLLRLNEGQGIHSIYHPTRIEIGGTWDHFLIAPFFNAAPFNPVDVRSAAVVGLAAGTIPRQAIAAFGPIPIDGFEIDPEIIRVGREYFDMNAPSLNAFAEDGRVGLARSKRTYDLIGVDAYRPPYIPWHLTTVEFFREVRDHLSERGALAINVGRAPEDRRLVEALTATLQQVFPAVFVMDVPNTFNSIVYATVFPASWENLAENFQRLSLSSSTPPILVNSMQRALAARQPTVAGDLIFRDDRAPIEWITHSLILNFVLSGGTETLQ